MIEFTITLDYEIFGDGLGDVKTHLVNPTDRILKICDKCKAKVTIMFDVAEYLAFKQHEEKGLLDHLCYSPSSLMEHQIKVAVSGGHDVQLHIHPQWYGSEFSDGSWKLRMENWRLPHLKKSGRGDESIPSIEEAMKQGKETLEGLLQPTYKGYKCQSFRAGAWCIQPEEEILQSMKKAGILADTSVYKNGVADDRSYYDFRQARKNYGYWWTTRKNICRVGKPGQNIIEIPIYSVDRPFPSLITPTRISTVLARRRLYRSLQKNSPVVKRRTQSFPKIHPTIPIKWDFCNLNAKELLWMLRLRKAQLDTNKKVPLVMIGHAKDFFNDQELFDFLTIVSTDYMDQLSFTTLSEVVERIIGDLN